MFFYQYFNQYYWDLLVAMTQKEIKVRYKHAALGFLWMFLNPVLQMLVVGFVFQFVFSLDYKTYFPYLLLGLLITGFVAQTLNQTTSCFVTGRQLIHKANFPKEIMILAIILANAHHLIIALGILLLLTMLSGKFEILSLGSFFVGLVVLGLLTTGVSFMTASINTRFRDVQYLVQAMLPLWFYATPVLYQLNMLPESWQFWFYLNPLTGILELLRGAMLSQSLNYAGIGIGILISVVLFGVGLKIYTSLNKYFVDWV